MSKIRTKKYNPLKHISTKIRPFELTPITAPLDELNIFLQRGYLTDNPVRLLSDGLPTEYHLMVMLHQHTFIIYELERDKNKAIVRYIKQIRSVIENFFKKILSLSEKTSENIIVPKSVSIGSVGAAKLIWFIVNSKKCLFNITVASYKQAIKNGILSASIKGNLEQDNPINYFVDNNISPTLLGML